MLAQPIHVVQRLDRDTSGAMVFARSSSAFTHLEHQLRRHTVHRRYLAIAHGNVRAATMRTFLADDRGDGLRGDVLFALRARRRIGQLRAGGRLHRGRLPERPRRLQC